MTQTPRLNDHEAPRPNAVGGAPVRRVLVCVGAGGVGKTTVAAALAVLAARQGKRVACLTIDPARRLASVLGIRADATRPTVVDLTRLAPGAPAPAGSLTVLMLDPKRTFDDLVRERAPSPEVRERIFRNRVYQHMSTHLAGVQSYMAMETVLRVMEDPAFDLLVLDTPPTNHALDFFSAPARLTDALDSAALGWFLEAFERERRFSFGLLGRGARLVLRGLGRLTGGGFLEQVAEFILDFNELFGGFRARALEVASALKSPDLGYSVVTTPESAPLFEASLLIGWLGQHAMQIDAVVVNQRTPPIERAPTEPELDLALCQLGLSVSKEKILGVARRAALAGKREQDLVARAAALAPEARWVSLPSLGSDAFGLSVLDVLATRLGAQFER